MTSAAEPVGPRLTPKLRDLLRQGMAMVLGASREILGAVVIGDETSAALVDAVRAEDAGRELITFGQTADACVACQGRFARERFPGLA